MAVTDWGETGGYGLQAATARTAWCTPAQAAAYVTVVAPEGTGFFTGPPGLDPASRDFLAAPGGHRPGWTTAGRTDPLHGQHDRPGSRRPGRDALAGGFQTNTGAPVIIRSRYAAKPTLVQYSY
ncbi:hypothetical protein [Streptomyces albireticuli]|uniref:hypothetical protein n=1 Tax=Streptomyces albireticuli TaxID=1940 RepID=UPI00117E9160|nr:hypothetical protein [Streptomyces albireticuli]MCD9145868.1 hypothetical protein [Streptomyces albireticuli]MCD9166145.1 hypothetical protein [Streptomyces albireticuli]MCD9189647.1 hypothetical protein [Streptomyces albireticuli]